MNGETKLQGHGPEWWAGLSKEEKDAVVEPLLNKTNKKIAEELGLKSKNQIAGVRHRINHKDPNYVPHERSSKPQSPKAITQGPTLIEITHRIQQRQKDKARVKISDPKSEAPLLPTNDTPNDTPVPVSLNLPLMALGDKMCKFPTSGPDAEQTLYCGNKTQKDYCDYHARRMHQGPSVRQSRLRPVY
ncbi:MAG: GcrA family cell cycle regulator [Candidatus Adlerbacteria bacterium]|nr:GcrA family cell cycle regulator [Candidatus Adlerbacteria bacterium]MDZ4225948.1 GcrA family cell cycle regulator [Patescibacteria group bacterium]